MVEAKRLKLKLIDAINTGNVVNALTLKDQPLYCTPWFTFYYIKTNYLEQAIYSYFPWYIKFKATFSNLWLYVRPTFAVDIIPFSYWKCRRYEITVFVFGLVSRKSCPADQPPLITIPDVLRMFLAEVSLDCFIVLLYFRSRKKLLSCFIDVVVSAGTCYMGGGYL